MLSHTFVLLLSEVDTLCFVSPAKHGEGPGHGRAGGDQSQGGADRSEGPRPQTQESTGGERV